MGDLQGAFQSLDGLAVGDSLGNLLTFQERHVLDKRELPGGPWSYTDDTEMAVSIYDQLARRGEIDQDRLATAFALRFNPRRGYGDGARRLLQTVSTSPTGAWRGLVRQMFFGTGSYGNGSAMRVAPLGAFFHKDYDKCAEQARLSAQVTHAHPEGEAGAIAVAIAAAWLRRDQSWDRSDFFATILRHTPPGLTREGIEKAVDVPDDLDGQEAGRILGNGHQIACQDTVPFSLWSAAVSPDDFETTFWRSIVAFGDQDTICAITCGIVAARTPAPAEWVARREKLPSDIVQPA